MKATEKINMVLFVIHNGNNGNKKMYLYLQ